MPKNTTNTVRMVRIFQRRFLYIVAKLVRVIRHHGLLPLVPPDSRARNLDPDLVRDLHLDRFLVQAGDLSVDAARGDDLVADLERLLKLLDLLLSPFHRQQNQKIEDPENERERQELEETSGALDRTRHSC